MLLIEPSLYPPYNPGRCHGCLFEDRPRSSCPKDSTGTALLCASELFEVHIWVHGPVKDHSRVQSYMYAEPEELL